MKTKLYERLAQVLHAIHNCAKSGNSEWYARHTETLADLVREHMPHGSGFDAGVQFDWDKSTPDRLIFNTSFHHMDEFGSYDGWSDHSVIVSASLAHGFDLRVTGKNRNEIKEYIAETFHSRLMKEVS